MSHRQSPAAKVLEVLVAAVSEGYPQKFSLPQIFCLLPQIFCLHVLVRHSKFLVFVVAAVSRAGPEEKGICQVGVLDN